MSAEVTPGPKTEYIWMTMRKYAVAGCEFRRTLSTAMEGRKTEACGARPKLREQAAVGTSRRRRDRSGEKAVIAAPAQSAPITLADERLFRASVRFHPGYGLVVDPAKRAYVPVLHGMTEPKTVVSTRPGASLR